MFDYKFTVSFLKSIRICDSTTSFSSESSCIFIIFLRILSITILFYDLPFLDLCGWTWSSLENSLLYISYYPIQKFSFFIFDSYWHNCYTSIKSFHIVFLHFLFSMALVNEVCHSMTTYIDHFQCISKQPPLYQFCV